MQRIPFFILISTLIFELVACTNDRFFEENIVFENGWSQNDSLVAEVSINDTSKTYEIGLYIDHDPTYPYQNIYIRAVTKLPDEENITSLIPIDLADKQGNWYGKCSNKECQAQVILKEQSKFEKTGLVRFVFKPYLRVDPIPGIRSLNFYIKIID